MRPVCSCQGEQCGPGVTEELDVARPEGPSLAENMTGSEEDGDQFRLEDRSMRREGVGPSVVLCSSFVYDISSAKVIVRFGAISVDSQLTRLAESGQTAVKEPDQYAR